MGIDRVFQRGGVFGSTLLISDMAALLLDYLRAHAFQSGEPVKAGIKGGH